MKEEFSGRGPGTRARENRRVAALGGVWEMEEERTETEFPRRFEMKIAEKKTGVAGKTAKLNCTLTSTTTTKTTDTKR